MGDSFGMLEFVASASTPFIGVPRNTFTCNVLGHRPYSGHSVSYPEPQVFQNESTIECRLTPSLKMVRFVACFASSWTTQYKKFFTGGSDFL
jgi:hypothetical protein